MANTSCNERAARLLELCLARGPAIIPEQWELLRSLAQEPCWDALFRIVAEGLSDRFEPALCDTYAELFAEALAPAVPGSDAAQLAQRYRRVRCVRAVTRDPNCVVVLSRVTLGADIAVTSVLLDAAKRRFPQARILFAGGRKNWELFAADARIEHLPVTYRRGDLDQRLAAWRELRADAGALWLDPDSRITQLGLLPVGDEENYRLFESRSWGADTGASLPELTAQWCTETLQVSDARRYIAPQPAGAEVSPPVISISLGVGENPAKRIAEPFETELIRRLAGRGEIWIDRGAGGEEAARVERAVAQSGVRVRFWDGSFAGFAGIIARSSLYVGYDSAGQHVAAACGVPLVCIFAGFPSLRMFQRWRPSGPGRIEIVRADDPAPARVLEETLRASSRLL